VTEDARVRASPIAAGLAAALLCLPLVSCDPDGLGRSNPNFLVVGHHGAPNLAAENTVRGFKASVAVGANAMEIDVCVTADHFIVAFHDRDPDDPIALARQAGGEGYRWVPFVPAVSSPWRKRVNQLTLAELRANYGYRRVDGGRDESMSIPTLREVLDWARSEPALRAVYLDLKFDLSELAAGPQLVDELWDAVQADPELQRVRFYLLTVHPEMVRALQSARDDRAANTLRVAWDFEQPGALEATLGAGLRDVSTGLTPSFTWSGYKREIAAIVQAREEGKVDSVLAWTFDRESELAELLYYSVDGVITNDPAVLSRMWEETLK
jgi:glycerophosphoryl diester phosphodiesterase